MEENKIGPDSELPSKDSEPLLLTGLDMSDSIDPFAEWEPGKILLDEYVVRRKLGRGGMGVVYLVEKNITMGLLQFAVKTLHPILFSRPGAKQSLLRELRTWMSLPSHPHIVACRFFRTIENRMVIFSEYVDGGSLTDWIRENRLRSLEHILDIAIQTAWALQAVHDRNVIHQDVKPSNILMTQDGIAKITDFGISNARRTDSIGPDSTPDSQQSILVSTRGCTPAYCSPEQAARLKVTRHTDMWSWAVTILHMVTGEVRWVLGSLVPQFLETIGPAQDSSLRFSIPASLHQFLVRCLQDNPKERWKNMAEAAVALAEIFREIAGRSYDRTAPDGTFEIGRPQQPYSRITSTGYVWADPHQWLTKAYEAHEMPCSAVTRIAGSRKDMMLADLEILEDAEALFKKLPEVKVRNYLDEMIAVIADKSVVLMELHDLPGAIRHYEQAIEWVLHNRALTEPKKTVLLLELYKRKGDALLIASSYPEAVDMYSLVRNMFRERTDIPDIPTMLSIRIRSGVNMAYTLYFMGRAAESVEINNELLNEMMTPAYHERVNVADIELGTLHLNQGLAFWQLGKLPEALQEYDAALDLQRRPDYQAKAPDAITDLAKTLSNKALILHSLGGFEEAECHLLEAILLIEKQLLEGTRSDLIGVLGVFYINLAGMYLERNAPHLGLRYVKKANELLNQNVHLEGVREFENQISRMLMFEASCMAGLGKMEQAILKINQAVALLERLAYEFNRSDLLRELASCFVYRAIIMEAAGQMQEASDSINQALRLRQSFSPGSETGDLQDTMLVARCIEARVRYKSGVTNDTEEIRDLIMRVEKELETTYKLKLEQQLDQMRQMLEQTDSEIAAQP